MSARRIDASVLPVRPVGHILQALVELAVFHVLCGNNAVSSTGVNQVLKLDVSRRSILASPSGRNGTAKSAVYAIRSRTLLAFVKFNGCNFGRLEDLGTTCFSVTQKDFVRLRSDYVPSVSVWATSSEEVGVCSSACASISVDISNLQASGCDLLSLKAAPF